jgi:hypothetical protein
MHSKRDDDLKDSFYLYIMRNSIGAGLRRQYAPNGRMPDRFSELLKELDSAESHGPGDKPARTEEHAPRPARKQIRKR